MKDTHNKMHCVGDTTQQNKEIMMHLIHFAVKGQYHIHIVPHLETRKNAEEI